MRGTVDFAMEIALQIFFCVLGMGGNVVLPVSLAIIVIIIFLAVTRFRVTQS